MKLKFILSALMGVALCSASMNAQTVTSNNPDAAKAVKCDKSKAACARAVKALKQGDRRGNRPGVMNKQRDAFVGLNLTADQQTKLQALKERRQQQVRERRQARPKPDSTLTREQRMAMRQQRDSVRRVEQVEYLREVRDIIGPDQYVTFLENIVVDRPVKMDRAQMKNLRNNRDGNRDRGRMARHDKKDRKDRRAPRAPRAEGQTSPSQALETQAN